MHLASELFLKLGGGLRVNHVPYRGSAAAYPDVLNGTIAMIIDVAASAVPFAQKGELRALAISGKQRSLEEYAALLASTGFRFTRAIDTHAGVTIVEGTV